MLGRVAKLPCLLLLIFLATWLPAADSRYTVKEGETLFSVARRAQVPVGVLSGYNGMADADKVKTGTVLRIPAVYMVKKGDTLYSISRAFSVQFGRLLDLNKFGQNARLKIGERIFIPQDAATAVSRSAAPVQKLPREDAPLATAWKGRDHQGRRRNGLYIRRERGAPRECGGPGQRGNGYREARRESPGWGSETVFQHQRRQWARRRSGEIFLRKKLVMKGCIWEGTLKGQGVRPARERE